MQPIPADYTIWHSTFADGWQFHRAPPQPLNLVKVDATLVTHLPCPNGRWLSFRAFDAYRRAKGTI